MWKFFSNVVRKKSIAFLLSDFNSNDFSKSLTVVSKKHDITGIRIYDRFEEEIPNIGFVPMIDQETFELKYIDTSSKKIRSEYQAKCLERKNYFRP